MRRKGCLIPVTIEIIETYLSRLQGGLIYMNGTNEGHVVALEERLVLATAMKGIGNRSLILVDRRQPAHDQLSILGLTTIDPYIQ
jgi:hypothetical protein